MSEIKKSGTYYRCNSPHDKTTIILCTESQKHGFGFAGVVVVAGNNCQVGEYSDKWTSYMFVEEVEYYQSLQTEVKELREKAERLCNAVAMHPSVDSETAIANKELRYHLNTNRNE